MHSRAERLWQRERSKPFRPVKRFLRWLQRRVAPFHPASVHVVFYTGGLSEDCLELLLLHIGQLRQKYNRAIVRGWNMRSTNGTHAVVSYYHKGRLISQEAWMLQKEGALKVHTVCPSDGLKHSAAFLQDSGSYRFSANFIKK